MRQADEARSRTWWIGLKKPWKSFRHHTTAHLRLSQEEENAVRTRGSSITTRLDTHCEVLQKVEEHLLQSGTWRNYETHRKSQLAHNWSDARVRYLDHIVHFNIYHKATQPQRERFVNSFQWRSVHENKQAPPPWQRPGCWEAKKELLKLQKSKREDQTSLYPSVRKRLQNRIDRSSQEYLEGLSTNWPEHFAEPARPQPSSSSSWWEVDQWNPGNWCGMINSKQTVMRENIPTPTAQGNLLCHHQNWDETHGTYEPSIHEQHLSILADEIGNVCKWRNILNACIQNKYVDMVIDHDFVKKKKPPSTLGRNICRIWRSTRTQKFEEIESLFNITQKLIMEHSEVILTVTCLDDSTVLGEPSWRSQDVCIISRCSGNRWRRNWIRLENSQGFHLCLFF